MKSSKKKVITTGLAITLAATLLIGGGTFAYLQGTTNDVVNNFHTNKVLVDLEETTGNDYEIIPGTTQEKDPKVTVNATAVSYTHLDVYKRQTPFRRIPYEEAMNRYGSDKPDTRFGMELVDLSNLLQNTEFKVFAGALSTGSVRGINVKGGAEKLSRKEIDKLVEYVKTYRAKGLAYTRLNTEEGSSSYEKFLSEEEKTAIRQAMGAETGDVILIVADPSNSVVYDSLGALRCHLAEKLELIPENSFDLLWVTDFPLFEYDEEEDRYVAKHHPFTAVADEDVDKLLTDPAHCHAKAYDMVLNGCEVGGGSIRINNPELQKKMFQALGFSEEEAQERFGFLINAFQYGAPPHGGMAYGLDRLVMLMLNKPSIRDVKMCIRDRC